MILKTKEKYIYIKQFKFYLFFSSIMITMIISLKEKKKKKKITMLIYSFLEG